MIGIFWKIFAFPKFNFFPQHKRVWRTSHTDDIFFENKNSLQWISSRSSQFGNRFFLRGGVLKLLKRSIQIWIQCFVWYIIWLYYRGGNDIFLILFIFCFVIITTFGYHNNDITVYCVILIHGLNSTDIVLLFTTWTQLQEDKFITNNKEMSSTHSHGIGYSYDH